MLESLLTKFKGKFEAQTIECTLEEKEALLKQLGQDYLVTVSPLSALNQPNKFRVTFLPRMTDTDKQDFKKLRQPNLITTRRAFTWEMLNIRNKLLLNSLKRESDIAKKSIKISDDLPELTVWDLCAHPFYVWLTHTTPTHVENLNLIREQLKRGTLWEESPFLSCCLQDAHTQSYAGSQSIAHNMQPFPISLMLSVDPTGIIGNFSVDARTPEGNIKNLHLTYVPKQTANIMKGDQKQEKDNHFLGSVEKILNQTDSYNEIVVLSGELARDWGVKPPEVKAIIIEKRLLENYKNNYCSNPYKYKEAIEAMIRLSEECHLPILLIETRPSDKLRSEIERAKYWQKPGADPFDFQNETLLMQLITTYLEKFKNLSQDHEISPEDKLWCEKKTTFLEQLMKQIQRYPNYSFIQTLEDQILVKMLIQEARIDDHTNIIQKIKSRIKENNTNTSDQRLLIKYEAELSKYKDQKKKTKADLTKYQQEFASYVPGGIRQKLK